MSEPMKLDLCTRCKNLKTIKRRYTLNKEELKYRCEGPCDRCGRRSRDLWPVTEKNALERLADVRRPVEEEVGP